MLKHLRELEIMELKAQRNNTSLASDTVIVKQSSYNELRSRLQILIADNESMRSMLSSLIPALRRLQKEGPSSIPPHFPAKSLPVSQHAQAFHNSPQKLSSRLIPQGFAQQQPGLSNSGPVPSTLPVHPLPSTSATLRLSRSSTNGIAGTSSMRSSSSSAMPLNAQGYFMA
jgi:hypothetical protein